MSVFEVWQFKDSLTEIDSIKYGENRAYFP